MVLWGALLDPVSFEARTGFEPVHDCFANSCVNHFTTAPRQTQLRLAEPTYCNKGARGWQGRGQFQTATEFGTIIL